MQDIIDNFDKLAHLNLSTKVTDEDKKDAIMDKYGVMSSKNGEKLLRGTKDLGATYNIRKGIKVICKNAFLGCSSLKSVTIPGSVIYIENGAFTCCHSLKNITIPENVKYIGNYAFYKRSSLINITIPENVKSIGDAAFYKCSSLDRIIFQRSIISIGKEAFYLCNFSPKLKDELIFRFGQEIFYCY